MLPQKHAFAGFLAIFLFYFFAFLIGISVSLLGLLAFFLANLLIDVDHYLIYVWQYHNFNLKRAFHHFSKILASERKKKPKNYVLCIFHTVEFIIVFSIFILWFSYHYPNSIFSLALIYIFAGMLFHIATDIIAAIAEHRIYSTTIYLFSLSARIMRVM